MSQVIDIEQEAFSPLWTSTSLKRDLKNRYASYFVACCAPDQGESGTEATCDPPENAYAWHRPLEMLQRLVRRIEHRADPGSSVAGYVSVWYQSDEAHITEIAVREKLRGRGIGELLLIGSLRAAVEYGSKVMTLEARVSNFIAQRLYEKYGFEEVGIRKAYYADNREDAVIMTTTPIDSEDYLRKFEELQNAYRSRWGEICIYQ